MAQEDLGLEKQQDGLQEKDVPYTTQRRRMKIDIDVRGKLIDELKIREVNQVLEVQCTGVTCWVCDCSGTMTMHHVLPKHLKPHKNVTVPVCHECHEKINEADIPGLWAYGYKINKQLKEAKTMLYNWCEKTRPKVRKYNEDRTPKR